MKRAWLRFIQRHLNPITMGVARRGGSRRSFWIIRHVGRTSGRVYETPIILARVPDGFVCELTYGDQVNWYRNIVAAGEATVIRGDEQVHIVSIEPISTREGRAAFRWWERIVLTLLRRREFRLLRVG